MKTDKFPKLPNQSLQFSSKGACILDKDFRSEKIRQHASALAKRNVDLRLNRS